MTVSGTKDDEQLKKARLRAMKLLERRDYTETRLRSKLKDSGFSDEAAEAAIEYVKSYGYVDDLRYAMNFIRTGQGIRSSRESERKLKERGVPAETIRAAFEAEGTDVEAEDELIKKLIIKRCPNPAELDNKAKNKLYAYMYNKGFSVDRVNRILEQLLDITY